MRFRKLNPRGSNATSKMSESFAALFEESLQRTEMRPGEVITAEVVRIEHSFVVVNAGLKSEAYVPLEEFKNDQGETEVQVGVAWRHPEMKVLGSHLMAYSPRKPKIARTRKIARMMSG